MVTKSLSPEANINLFKPPRLFPGEINLAEKAVKLSSVFAAEYFFKPQCSRNKSQYNDIANFCCKYGAGPSLRETVLKSI